MDSNGLTVPVSRIADWTRIDGVQWCGRCCGSRRQATNEEIASLLHRAGARLREGRPGFDVALDLFRQLEVVVAGRCFCQDERPRAPLFPDIPHASGVYRVFDADHRLLYVGSSKDMANRIREHREEKHWSLQMAHVVVELMPVEESRRVEAAAIINENPIHNKAGRRPAGTS